MRHAMVCCLWVSIQSLARLMDSLNPLRFTNTSWKAAESSGDRAKDDDDTANEWRWDSWTRGRGGGE